MKGEMMNMYPEPLVNGIMLDGRLIPAVNVQIWDNPPVTDAHGHVYGNYFEVPFEDGDLWVVEQMISGGPVDVTWYEAWPRVEKKELSMDDAEAGMMICPDWEYFLDRFIDKAANGTRF